ncbi:hypothetical protein vBDshSR4C_022 [Dinoroseobacter phage vB_DshS-R4C]|nr:hypothetical protein vBDshSR4C_022 [Dinoroseobacter phage vB_DshS-R4C]
MPQPTVAGNDTAPAIDARYIPAGSEHRGTPLPRGLYALTDGEIKMECPLDIPAIPVNAGEVLPARPRAILADTTAALLALY